MDEEDGGGGDDDDGKGDDGEYEDGGDGDNDDDDDDDDDYGLPNEFTIDTVGSQAMAYQNSLQLPNNFMQVIIKGNCGYGRILYTNMYQHTNNLSVPN